LRRAESVDGIHHRRGDQLLPLGRGYTLFGRNALPLCDGVADRVLAGLAQSGEVLFDAQQQPTCAEFDTGALLPDIRLAGFAHCGDLHERGLARFTEFFEMCLGTFGKSISFRFGSVTKPGYIPATIQYGSDILTRRGRRRQQHNHCKSQTNSTHADLQSAPPSLVELQIGQLSMTRKLRSSELVAIDKELSLGRRPDDYPSLSDLGL